MRAVLSSRVLQRHQGIHETVIMHAPWAHLPSVFNVNQSGRSSSEIDERSSSQSAHPVRALIESGRSWPSSSLHLPPLLSYSVAIMENRVRRTWWGRAEAGRRSTGVPLLFWWGRAEAGMQASMRTLAWACGWVSCRRGRGAADRAHATCACREAAVRFLIAEDGRRHRGGQQDTDSTGQQARCPQRP
jgi:hypothetical protein